MLDQQFASFHKSLHRKEEVEEIRYVLERVQTSPGLTLLFSILRQNENDTPRGMNQRFLDKCFRFAEKTRRHVYYHGIIARAVRFLGKKLRIPGNRARFLMSYPTREIHSKREAEGVDLSRWRRAFV